MENENDEPKRNAPDHFEDEIRRLIERFRLEYQITYGEVIGVLEILKLDMYSELREETEESGGIS